MNSTRRPRSCLSTASLGEAVFVGLDLSLNCSGVSVVRSSGTSFDYETLLIQPGDKLRSVRRLAHNRDKFASVLSLLKDQNVVGVCIEDYAFGIKGGRLASLGEWGGIVRLMLHDAGLDEQTIEVSPNTLKKFTVGDHLAKKEAMLLQCFKKWRAEFGNSDEADAFALSMYAFAKFDSDGYASATGLELSKAQQDCLRSSRPLLRAV